MAIASICIFSGPTAAGAALNRLPPDVKLRPPLARNDLARFVRSSPKPGALAIVDGTFHQTLAVSHVEIRDALSAGWHVWGLSSMGAIRAAEMTHLGMKGYGEVFKRFLHSGYDDDEVALLHTPSAPYLSLSEPLVHLRHAAEVLVQEELLTSDNAAEITGRLKKLWFGERTVPLFRRLASACLSTTSIKMIDDALGNFGRFRLKSRDLADFINEGPWRAH